MRWLCIGLFAASLGIFEVSASEAVSISTVRCEAGNCFYRKRHSSLIKPFDEGSSLKLGLGDVVMGVGSGTRIQVLFEDGSMAELRDSGLMKIMAGKKAMNLTDGTEGLKPTPKPTPKGSNLVYVGSFPLRVLTPSIEEPLIFQSFPQELRIVIEPMIGTDAEKVKSSYLLWSLGDVEIVFLETSVGSQQYAASVKISAPGEFLLKPRSSVSEEGIRLQVLGKDALEGQLQNLLKNSDANSDAGIELRGK